MNFSDANAAIRVRRRVFPIAQFPFDFDIRTFLQRAGPFHQLAPAQDAMPFGAGLVLAATFLFPAHARGE